jgi:hypothetical protein
MGNWYWSSLKRLLLDLIVYMSNTAVSYKKQELRNLHEHLISSLFFFYEICVAHIINFLCCPIMCLYVLSCDVRYDFRIKTMFGSSLHTVVQVVGEAYVLFTLFCVCLRIVVSNTYYVLFCLSSCCVPYVAGFSGLSIFDYLFCIH